MFDSYVPWLFWVLVSVATVAVYVFGTPFHLLGALIFILTFILGIAFQELFIDNLTLVILSHIFIDSLATISFMYIGLTQNNSLFAFVDGASKRRYWAITIGILQFVSVMVHASSLLIYSATSKVVNTDYTYFMAINVLYGVSLSVLVITALPKNLHEAKHLLRIKLIFIFADMLERIFAIFGAKPPKRVAAASQKREQKRPKT